MRLDTLRNANRERNEKHFPTCADWTASDWSNALAGEVGELCNLVKKFRRGDTVDGKDIANELADVVIYADLVAQFFKIGLSESIVSKFNAVSDRVNSDIKLKSFDEYEIGKIDAENELQFYKDYMKMNPELKENFQEWKKDVELQLSN